jgi:hypothetical protein
MGRVRKLTHTVGQFKLWAPALSVTIRLGQQCGAWSNAEAYFAKMFYRTGWWPFFKSRIFKRFHFKSLFLFVFLTHSKTYYKLSRTLYGEGECIMNIM